MLKRNKKMALECESVQNECKICKATREKVRAHYEAAKVGYHELPATQLNVDGRVIAQCDGCTLMDLGRDRLAEYRPGKGIVIYERDSEK